MNFSTQIKIEFFDWIKNSTSHGLPQVFNRDKPLIIRLVWLALFVASSVLCFISIIQSIQVFYEYEALIKIEIEKDISVQYPTISFCNLNQYQTSFAIDFVKSIISNENISFGNETDSLNKIEFLTKSNLVNTTNEFKNSMSYSIETMIISCLFAALPCSKNDFEWFYSNEYGNCYRYNFDERKKRTQTRSGKFYGLRLELYVGESESIYSLSTHSGVHVFITNNSNEHLSNGFDVSSGVSTDLSISRLSFNRLAQPFSNCFLSNNENLEFSEFSKKTLEIYKDYNKEACVDLCFQNYLEEKCKCFAINYHSFNLNIPCSTLAKLECINNNTLEFFDNFNNIKNCEDKCPFKCEQLDFNYLVSFSDYPSQVYADSLLRQKYIQEKFINKTDNLNYEKIKSSILSLNIYYSSFDLFKITEVESISLIDLISSIGGTLGLYIGISILSFFEILEFIFKFFVLIINHKNSIHTKN